MSNDEKVIKDLRALVSVQKGKLEVVEVQLQESTYKARMAVNAAHTLRIFFDAALQQYGKGNADFNRFFSGTDFAPQVTKIVESYLRKELEQMRYLEYLEGIQTADAFNDNFNVLVCHYDEFEQFVHDMLGTGLLGGRVFPENYDIVTEAESPEWLNEKVKVMDDAELDDDFDELQKEADEIETAAEPKEADEIETAAELPMPLREGREPFALS